MQQNANWVLGMTCLHRGIAPMDDIPSVTALHQDEEVNKSITNARCPHNQQIDYIMKEAHHEANYSMLIIHFIIHPYASIVINGH